MRKSGLGPPAGLDIVAGHQHVRPDAGNGDGAVVHGRTHQRTRPLGQVRQPGSGSDREASLQTSRQKVGAKRGPQATSAPRGLWWDAEPWRFAHTGKHPFCHSESPLSDTRADPRPSDLAPATLGSEPPPDWPERPPSPSTAAGGNHPASGENTARVTATADRHPGPRPNKRQDIYATQQHSWRRCIQASVIDSASQNERCCYSAKSAAPLHRHTRNLPTQKKPLVLCDF